MKSQIIIIGGATCIGKTNTAINLAMKINGEIISADSMQVYKYMNIGTAKPSKEELNKVKHYLIDELEPNERFSIARFKKRAEYCIKEIYSKGKIPIIVGGTGFYINSLIYNTSFDEKYEKDNFYRNYLYELKEEKGSEILYSMLKAIDPIAAKKIHINNTKRIIRALEYFYCTGKKISKNNLEQKKRKKVYDAKVFILNLDRKKLYERIEERVDTMVENGLIEEVQDLLKKGFTKELSSMQGIGYKEIIEYLKGEYDLQEAVKVIKRNTRRFAKRQLTWFRNKIEGNWISLDEFNNDELLLNNILKLIKL